MDLLPAVALLLVCFVLGLSSGWAMDRDMERHLKRQKRDWVIPPQQLKENYDYTSRKFVAKIRSDHAGGEKMYYFLSGPGVDKDPVNLFIVDEGTGLVRLRGILDREVKSSYDLAGVAKFRNGTIAESSINISIEVVDENDNSPIFAAVPTASITESSAPGTLVTQVTATDIDQPNHPNSKISYTIAKQEPPEESMQFQIDKDTGYLYVKESTIDRERQSSYILTIKGTDLDGAAEGNTGTTTVKVNVLDINDNIPTLEKDEYSGSIPENKANIEVMRFKTLDKDLEHTDNWNAVFDIVSGNDDQIFSIETDPQTNEGILLLNKVLENFLRHSN